ncbi:MAG: hypothetical protein VCD00_04490 [Candidatus Hydrogenedentota bacterium]
MMRLFLCLTMLVFTVMNGYAQVEVRLIPEIVSLQKFSDDPVKLVDAARRYQLQQADLTGWDLELAHRHDEADENASRDSKADQIRKRTANMKAVWDYVLGEYPNNPRALNYFGEFWYDYGGDTNKAITYWKRSAALDPSTGFADNNLGLHYFHTGQYKFGHNYLQKALTADETNPDFLFNIAQMYLTYFVQLEEILKKDRKRLFREAMRYSKDAAKYAPDDFEIVQDYAVNFFAGANLGVEVDWKTAADAWVDVRALVTNREQRFYTLLNEGRCWTRDEDSARALERYEQALALRPQSIITQELVVKTKAALKQP